MVASCGPACDDGEEILRERFRVAFACRVVRTGRAGPVPFAAVEDEDGGSCSWEAERLLLVVANGGQVHLVETVALLRMGESFRKGRKLVENDVVVASVVEEPVDSISVEAAVVAVEAKMRDLN